MISPDGRWIAYQSNESGRYEIYVQPFPGGGQRIQVSPDNGVYPRWSPRGDELFFRSASTRAGMSAAAFDGRGQFSRPQQLFELRRFESILEVSPDAQRFLMMPAEARGAAPAVIHVVTRGPAGERQPCHADTAAPVVARRRQPRGLRRAGVAALRGARKTGARRDAGRAAQPHAADPRPAARSVRAPDRRARSTGAARRTSSRWRRGRCGGSWSTTPRAAAARSATAASAWRSPTCCVRRTRRRPSTCSLLSDAIDRLALQDERKAQIVELHFFGGLTCEETAEALAVSVTTIERELRVARAWLHRDLAAGAP